MTIARKPAVAADPEAFLAAADHPDPSADPPAKGKGKKKDKDKKRKKKEPTMIRFDDEQLEAIDRHAKALGLSRAAWVRMVVAQALGRT